MENFIYKICKENDWKFDNEKQRGMAFESWGFNLLNNSYNESENRLNDCVIRTNDFQIDICFPSKEFSEVYFIPLLCSFLIAHVANAAFISVFQSNLEDLKALQFLQ